MSIFVSPSTQFRRSDRELVHFGLGGHSTGTQEFVRSSLVPISKRASTIWRKSRIPPATWVFQGVIRSMAQDDRWITTSVCGYELGIINLAVIVFAAS